MNSTEIDVLRQSLAANSTDTQVAPVTVINEMLGANFDGLRTAGYEPNIEEHHQECQMRHALEVTPMGGFRIEAVAFEGTKHRFLPTLAVVSSIG